MCKTCSRCKVTYDDVNSNFYKCKLKVSGYSYLCKICDKKRDALRYYKYHDKQLERNRKYIENNREKIKERKNTETSKAKKRITGIKLKKKYRDTLADCYIKGLLKNYGYKDITQDMIESKRESIKNYRKHKILNI